MKFVTQKIHSYLDYPVAALLIASPFLLGLGQSNPFAFQLSLFVGIAALVLSLLTDHETGVIKIIPYRIHLAVDFMVAIVFIIVPFIFSFQGLDFYYYLANGTAVLFVVGLNKPQPAY